ncbi:probable hemagglutinin-related protein [uncultured Candidatus Thioglobus sp.]|nr:probable hemagglutinin-related protein [uncultured Candidatus Thioglobus sp.]
MGEKLVKNGKITKKDLKDAGLDEYVDIVDDLNTIVTSGDPVATGLAIADFIIGTNFNSKKTGSLNRLRDKDTLLQNGKFTKTKLNIKNGTVYKGKDGKYYHKDTLHRGKGAELEVYNKFGKHIGIANPKTGKIDFSKVKKGRRINVK